MGTFMRWLFVLMFGALGLILLIFGASFASHENAAAEIAAYPAGARATAHVDEAHPDKAFLKLETG